MTLQRRATPRLQPSATRPWRGQHTPLRPLSFLLATAGLVSLPAYAQVAGNALPSGGVVAVGSAAINSSGSAMRVDQSSNKAIIDWNTFNIGRDATVRFNQPSSNSITLNRVGADGGRSIIDGGLSANGQVWLLNSSGILFSATATINTGGLLASSMGLTNENFMAGNYRFSQGAGTPANIENLGKLTAAEGGYVALLAPEVRNEGVITARLGTVALASGSELRLDLTGDRLIEVQVDQAAVNGLIDNKNLVQAEGGWVLMSAGAANSLESGGINNTGIVTASSATEHGGVIRLEGGFAALGGTLSADGTAGGSITVATSRALSLADGVSARGSSGAGGSVAYSTGGALTENDGSHTNASGATDGGRIRAVAQGGILSSGTYQASGSTGHGGLIDLSGSNVRLLSATLDASGKTEGGLVRVGGAFQGGKAQDPSSDVAQAYIGRNTLQFGTLPTLQNTQRTFVNDSTRINVAASGGTGGTAVVWSDKETTQLGSINASGSSQGGAVEISSGGDLRYVNLAGVNAGNGRVLLDPKNIVIGDFAAASGWAYQAILGKGYASVPAKSVDVAGLEAGDAFGISVALNATGDRLAVGAKGDAGFGNVASGSGAVRLYSFTDTSFSGATLQATLGKGYTGGKNVDLTSLEAGDNFGYSVALNALGNRLAVGSYADDGSGNSMTDSGAVSLFSFADASFSGGTLEGMVGKGYAGGKNIDVSSLGATDIFGASVSLNAAGDRLAVGAYLDDGSGNSTTDSGAVHLFSFADSNFSSGALQATIGKGYTGGKNIDLNNLVAVDNFGFSASLNAIGDRLAVGALRDNGSGNSATDSGAVYLFGFSDNNFTGGALQATVGKGYAGGKNVDVSSLQTFDTFGSGVSLNAAGDRLAVGAFGGVDGGGNRVAERSAVRLFSFTDTSFSGGTLEATIGKGFAGGKNVDMPSLEPGDNFGSSVSLNAIGDRLAVGAYGDDGFGNTKTDSGAVHLFSFTDPNFSGGAQVATMGKGYASNAKNVDVAGLEAADQFGTSVALNAAGDKLAVGAMVDAGFGNVALNSGAVRLYSFSDANFNGATLQATLGKGYTGGKNVDVAGLEIGDFFGVSVALNAVGDRLAVGAHGDAGFGNVAPDSGAARLFGFADTSFSGGILQATLGKGYIGGNNVDLAGLESSDRFGASVALNAAGDRLAVGAYQDSGSGNAAAQSGAVRLFSFADTSFSGAALQATLGKGYTGGKNVDVAGLEANDWFGNSVSLNATGDLLAVGAAQDSGSGNVASQSGSVRLYSFTDTNFNGAALQATLGKGYTGGKNLDVVGLEANDQFGDSLALNAAGDRLAVGAKWDAGFGNIATNSGAVRLFSFTDTSFSGATLQATLGKGYTGGKNVDVAGLESGDQFGSAVALNGTGDRLAAGAMYDAGAGNIATNSGAVHLFTFTDPNFSGGAQVATMGKGYTAIPAKSMDVPGLDANEYFGLSVALNAAGDRLAVGAFGDAGISNGSYQYGAVRLYSFTDSNFSGGALQATLGQGYTGGKNMSVAVPSGGTSGNMFGDSVSFNAIGDRLAVGAYGDSVDAGRGAVMLFSFADNNFSTGVLEASLCRTCPGGKNFSIPTLTNWVRFGSGVSLNATGDRLAVGAHMDNGPVDNGRGSVRLFSFTDNKFSGTAQEALLTTGATGGKNVDVPLDVSDGFGLSVSLNAVGDRLAAGAYRDAGAGNTAAGAGAVRLFSFTDGNFSGGTLQATLGKGYTGGKNIDVPGLEAGDTFVGVALNAAGDKLAVGAGNDAGFGNVAVNSGSVRIFTFADGNFTGGTQQGILGKGYTGGNNFDVTGLDANDHFGGAVAFNAAGNRLAVGAHSDAGFGNTATNSGAVYLFSATATAPTAGILAFATNPTGNENIDSTALQNLLSAGTSVTLQANNDITLNAGSNILVNNPSGNGGDLILQAGRSVLLNSDISTDNGNFSAIAGDPGASPANRDAGLPQVNVGAVLDVGTGTATLAAIGGDVLRSGSGAVLTSGAGRFLLYAADPGTSFRGFGTASKHYNQTYTGSTPSYASAGNWELFSIAPTLSVAANSQTLVYGSTPGFTPVLTGFIDGDTSASASGNAAFTVAGVASTSGNPTVGAHDAVYNTGLASSLGYQFINNASVVNELTVTPAVLAVTGLSASNKTYDGTTAALLTGTAQLSPVGADAVTLGGTPVGVFASANVGNGIAVNVTGHNLSGADAGNYSLLPPSGLVAAITAPVYELVPTTTVVVASSGTPVASVVPPSVAAIAPVGGTGSGGVAMDNFPVKSASTATSATESVTTVTASVAWQDAPAPAMPKLVLDASKSFPTLARVLSRLDLQTMYQTVKEARTKLFADALSILAKDPSRADVPDCVEGSNEVCLAKPKDIEQSEYLPTVKRKIAMLIGNNAYQSPIDSLETPINDVTAIADQLRDNMGYEVKIVKNASRQGMVEAFNDLIRNTDKDDSLLVMYAGHGYLDESSKKGYWIPTDARADNPNKWLSNDIIARALRYIPAKQVILVSDSCYSGTLTKEGKVVNTVGMAREQTLTRRSVLAFSSGGDEPVSDEGHDNHSIFAWNLIGALKTMQAETSGTQLHARIKEAVTKEAPQEPQYGTVVSAGHKEGGEYLLTPTASAAKTSKGVQ